MAADVADMTEGAAEAKPVGKAKRSRGKLLLLGINLVLFMTGTAFFLVTKFGILDSPMTKDVPVTSGQLAQGTQTGHSPAKDAEASSVDQTPQEPLVDFPMRPFVVNLSDQSGRRYLRLTLQLEVKGEKAKKTIAKHLAPLRNHLIFLLSSKTFDDIRSAQGKYQLQAEISQQLNDALGEPLVSKVYFTEFIVQ